MKKTTKWILVHLLIYIIMVSIMWAIMIWLDPNLRTNPLYLFAALMGSLVLNRWSKGLTRIIEDWNE